MAAPQAPPNCPPGLEYLTQVDQLLVHQQVELLEGRSSSRSSIVLFYCYSYFLMFFLTLSIVFFYCSLYFLLFFLTLSIVFFFYCSSYILLFFLIFSIVMFFYRSSYFLLFFLIFSIVMFFYRSSYFLLFFLVFSIDLFLFQNFVNHHIFCPIEAYGALLFFCSFVLFFRSS